MTAHSILAPMSAGYATPRASAGPGGLAGLVGGSSVINAEEAELRDIQRRPTAIAFPARVGVLFYEYSDPLKQEDSQAIVEALGKQMIDGKLVSVVSQIPKTVVPADASLDSLRKLAARFQVDVLLLVSGAQTFDRADAQPTGWFASFSNTTSFEARTTLTGLAIGVYSGTFLTPFQVVGKAGPLTLDPSSPSFGADAYVIKKEAHEGALKRLREEFMTGLQRAKEAQDSAPPPTPTPSPSPQASASPSPSAAPAASASPSASPSAAASPGPSASPSPTATP